MIYFNGNLILSNQPVPFLGFNYNNIVYGERWGREETYTLDGFLTGCSKEELEEARTNVLADFNNAFGNLYISGIFQTGFVEIKSISFDNSEYIGILPYNVSFSHYPSGSFTGVNHSGYFGVLDPSDEITFNQTDNGIVEISRSISAKGILTQSGKNSAIDNAINFVRSRTGVWINPVLIDYEADIEKYLATSEESINRISNTVSLSQTFYFDPLDPAQANVINRYTYDITEDLSKQPVVSYQGQIDAGRYGLLEDVRTKYKNFKKTIPIVYELSENITEDPKINRLTYSFSFLSGIDANSITDVADDFTITVKESSNTSLFEVSIDGGLEAKKGCISERFSLVENELNSVERSNFHFNYCEKIYKDFYDTSRLSFQDWEDIKISLNQIPKTYNKTFSEKRRTASYNAIFDDRFTLANTIYNFDSSININLSIDKKAVKEHYTGGKYFAQDLGFSSRETLNVSCSAKNANPETDLKTFIESELLKLSFNSNGIVYIEEENYNKNERNQQASYSKRISYNPIESFNLDA
jgi:hypothetical protein